MTLQTNNAAAAETLTDKDLSDVAGCEDDDDAAASPLSKLTFETTRPFSWKGRHFKSKVLDVYDGDTCTIAVTATRLSSTDQFLRIACRLMGIDTPELKTRDVDEKKAAIAARNHLVFLIMNQPKIQFSENTTRLQLRNMLSTNRTLHRIECFDFDKYGRLLINVWDSNGQCLNERMIRDGFAVEYDGGTKKKFDTTRFS